MCGLCQLNQNNIFGNPLEGTHPEEVVKRRAAKVKRMIRIHEKRIANDKKLGNPECGATVDRLKALRAEQYELARNL